MEHRQPAHAMPRADRAKLRATARPTPPRELGLDMLPTVEPTWQLGARLARSPAFGVAVMTCLVFTWIAAATTSPRPAEVPSSTGVNSTRGHRSTTGSDNGHDPRFTAELNSRPAAGSASGSGAPMPQGDLPSPGGSETVLPLDQPADTPDYSDVPEDPDMTAALNGLPSGTPEQLTAMQQGIQRYEMYAAQQKLARQAGIEVGLPATVPQDQTAHGTLPAAPGPAIAPDPNTSPPAPILPDDQSFVPSGQPPGPTP